uniref:glucuronosyl-galactosyl-proteoglycan 4-alpha-N-acetylglucosaminyltransferase n=1 Tax=Cacopsylla melanoneura TaxID=428564 RepID=A0A8D9DRV7_9HEMI
MTVLASSTRFCWWFTKIKLSRIILLLLLILVMAPLFAHYFLSEVERNSSAEAQKSKIKLDSMDDFTSQYKILDIKKRINDMMRIKGSVSQELRDLESKRLDMMMEINSYVSKIDQIKQDILHYQDKLDKLKVSMNQAQLAHTEALRQNSPQLYPPLMLKASSIPHRHRTSLPPLVDNCRTMSKCFDYSRCSLTSGLPVFVYNTEEYFPSWKLSLYLRTTILQAFRYNPHYTSNPKEACIFIVLIGESESLQHNVQDLHKLPYWGDGGRNHILINLSRNNLVSSNLTQVAPSVHTGYAIIAQSVWSLDTFRPNLDLVTPPGIGLPGGDIWSECPYLLPARRKYLLSYQGWGGRQTMPAPQARQDKEEIGTIPPLRKHRLQVSTLTQFLTSSTSDLFHLDWSCTDSHNDLCYTESKRGDMLRQSTFVLIYADDLTGWNINSEDLVNDTMDNRQDDNKSDDEQHQLGKERYVSTIGIQMRLYEALKYGAVPVIIGGDDVNLPYEEVLDWKRIAIRLPVARLPELHLLLRSVPDEDIVSFRHQGRQIFTRYLATLQSQLDTLISVLRDRLNIPPLPVVHTRAVSVFREGFTPLKMDPVIAEAEPEENLGPLEPPYPSPTFRRNYTLFMNQGYEMWNTLLSPFYLYPHLPNDPTLPSDAKFMGSDYGFRPINKGAGGSGKEFYENLGSNKQREQFTIVILTYERDQVLINSLSRLNNLPYLNKVVVVWNSVQPPRDDLRWPDIGVPVHVVRTNSNDLNNRFKPYDVIETEAVLNMDDDVYLRHDEIMFAFRVWREQRDRIVGFPGRYHAWDLNNQGGWLYNSNYSCELSMVLTGAAFIHTYYLHEYTHVMPQAIRDQVAQDMNCEDIAMNFLVSHMTRKPPVKVTSRWTFRCPGCPVTLSEDDSHFQERHKCIQLFSRVYGYNPLLYTQFRVDSVGFRQE